jgi:hypothetical protein
MIQITVSDEQARLITEASVPIILIDSHGRTIGEVAPVAPGTQPKASISDEEWAEIQRRMADDDGTRYTHAEMMERLRELAPE